MFRKSIYLLLTVGFFCQLAGNLLVGGEVELSQLLPRHAEIQSITEFNRDGSERSSRKAIIKANLEGFDTEEVIIAYRLEDGLHIKVLHLSIHGYVEHLDYKAPGNHLWVQNFKTVGLQALDLLRRGIRELVVISAIGASVGGNIVILHWNGEAFVPILEDSGHKFDLADLNGDGVMEVIVATKYSGDIMAPSRIYSWDGAKYSPANLKFPRYFQAEVQKYIELANSLPKGSLDRLNYMLFIAEEYGNMGRANDGIFQAQAVISEAQDLLREPGVDPREKKLYEGLIEKASALTERIMGVSERSR